MKMLKITNDSIHAVTSPQYETAMFQKFRAHAYSRTVSCPLGLCI